jgi:hypothetical protein
MWLTPVENAAGIALSVIATLIGLIVCLILAVLVWEGAQWRFAPELVRAFRFSDERVVRDGALDRLVGLPLGQARQRADEQASRAKRAADLRVFVASIRRL